MLDSVKDRIRQYGIVADALRFIRRTDRGKPNGVASLDNDGLILVDQLPDAALVETDPTVPDWAKDPEKPKYTAEEVGADASGTATKVTSEHNVATDTHNDIRVLISDLSTKLTNFLGIDDTSSTKLSELLQMIVDAEESTDIEALTSSKINYTDIIDNLTTNLSNKPLSAAQGVAVKLLIDNIRSDLNNYALASTVLALEERVEELEDALGGFKLRGGTSAPTEADEFTLTFVDVR